MKKAKKLQLSRSTIVRLDKIEAVAGGVSDDCSNSCITACGGSTGDWDSDIVKLKQGGKIK